MSDNGAYMKKVLLQAEDLNAVIEKIKSEDFVDKDNIYLLGSSIGGVTVATCAVTHTDDIMLQYPAIFLNEQAYEIGAEYDVNGYKIPSCFFRVIATRWYRINTQ